LGINKYFPNITNEEIDRILEIADADGSGEIDYSEWVVATIDKKKLLSDKKMIQAFKLFDKDGGGSISPEEVKKGKSKF
jgi:calcium-dependent protein kinase